MPKIAAHSFFEAGYPARDYHYWLTVRYSQAHPDIGIGGEFIF